MAHYVFQRNNGWGDYDYIRSFETMEITDYKEFAAQVEDRYLPYLDIPYLNSLGFYAIGITQLALRIEPLFLFRPLVRNYRPTALPRAARARGAAPGPRPTAGPMPSPRAQRVAPPRTTAPKPAPLPKAPARPAPARPTAAKPMPAQPGPVGRNAPGGRTVGRGPADKDPRRR